MKERVRTVQHDAEVSVRFMQAWEEKLYYEMKAREEGREEGKLLLKQLAELLKKDGREELISQILFDDELLEKLMKEYG